MTASPSIPSRAAEQLAAALVADDLEVVEAAARASRALAAWSAFPRAARVAYAAEAGRLARRAAWAVAELLDVAAGRDGGR